METSRSLCNCLLLIDIVRLKTTSMSNPSDAPYGRPTYAKITFLELFIGPCIDRPEVVDERPDYAAAPGFGVLCWGYVAPCASVLDGRGAKLRGGEISSGLMQILFLSLIFSFFLFVFLFFFFLLFPLPHFSSWPFLSLLLAFFDFPFGLFLFSFSDCKQPSTFVWIFL